MKFYGKEKCRILKQIRAEIAKQNDIEWVVSECKHQGDCRGTCPKCEQEVRQLEAALARREALGKAIAVVGISAGLSLSVAGCANPFATQGHMEENPAGNLSGNRPAVTDAATDALLDTETMVVDGEMLPPESETELLDGEMPPVPGEVPEEETEPGDTEGTDDELITDALMGEPEDTP